MSQCIQCKGPVDKLGWRVNPFDTVCSEDCIKKYHEKREEERQRLIDEADLKEYERLKKKFEVVE